MGYGPGNPAEGGVIIFGEKEVVVLTLKRGATETQHEEIREKFLVSERIIQEIAKETGYGLSQGGNHLYAKYDGFSTEVAERAGADYSILPFTPTESVRDLVAKTRFYRACEKKGVDLKKIGITDVNLGMINDVREALSFLEAQTR